MKTNILFISNHVSKTGAPAVLQLLLNYIKANHSDQYTVYVSSLLMADIKKEDRERWEKTYNCFFTEFVYDINSIELSKIPIITSLIDIDIVYGNGVATLPQLYMFKKHDSYIKTILHVHENADGFQKIKETFGYNFTEALNYVDYFITVSRWQISELQQHGILLNNITNLPEPIDIDRLNQTLKNKSISKYTKTRVFGCGKGESRKGIDRFIEVSKHFDPNSYEFIWIGDVEIVENHVVLNGFGVFDDYKVEVGNVKFVGQVETPAELLNCGDTFLMLSRQDPCPLVVLEALYSSLFVVTIKESGDSHIYCNEHDEILDTYNCDDVVSAIHSIEKKKKNEEIVRAKYEYYKILNNIVNPNIICQVITHIIKNMCKCVTLYNTNNFEGTNHSNLWTQETSTVQFNQSYSVLELNIDNVLNETNTVEFIFDEDYDNAKILLIQNDIPTYNLVFDISGKKKLEIKSKLKKVDNDKRDLGTYFKSIKIDGIQVDNKNSINNDVLLYHDQKLNVNLFDKSDKIVFYCISGTSGYGVLARETVLNLRNEGYLVNYKPFEFEKSINDHDDTLMISDFEESDATCYILNFPPHILTHVYNNLIGKSCKNKKIISFPLWESEYINFDYVSNINRVSSSVIVSSHWNKNALIKCGVIKDIQVIRHKPILKPLVSKNKASKFIYKKSILFGEHKDLNSTVNFYTIGQWTNRKGITDTLESFCEAFTKNDNVALILKTHYQSHQQNDVLICIDRIKKITRKNNNSPTIYYINYNLFDDEMINIHSCGDIYVSATKSEGIGLGPITAAQYDKPVLITQYGAQYEYLKDNHSVEFVSYKLIPAQDDLSFCMDLKNQLWAHPDKSDMINKMKKMYLKYYENDISYYSW